MVCFACEFAITRVTRERLRPLPGRAAVSNQSFTAWQPVEFCSDVFLLPLGSPPKDTLDLSDSEDEKAGEPLPPAPPPLDPAIYEILIQSLDNNNRPPPVQTAARHKLRHASSDNAERYI